MHKHKHKHNECSHLLHKHKEIDIRKRNELQNEAARGYWMSYVFKMADENEILEFRQMTLFKNTAE